MTLLSPYHPPQSTIFSFSYLPKSSKIRLIPIALIIIWELAVFFGIIFPAFVSSTNGFSVFCLLVILSLGGAAGIIVGFNLLWRYFINLKLGEAQLVADRDVIRRGDELRIIFRQPVKQQTALDHVTIRFMLQEWVRYTQGTNTYTDLHNEIVDEQVFGEQLIEAGDTIEKKVRFRVPSDAMHTFSDDHNRLNWLVTVQVGIKVWPDFYERYEVTLPV